MNSAPPRSAAPLKLADGALDPAVGDEFRAPPERGPIEANLTCRLSKPILQFRAPPERGPIEAEITVLVFVEVEKFRAPPERGPIEACPGLPWAVLPPGRFRAPPERGPIEAWMCLARRCRSRWIPRPPGARPH